LSESPVNILSNINESAKYQDKTPETATAITSPEVQQRQRAPLHDYMASSARMTQDMSPSGNHLPTHPELMMSNINT
jgi:hypothetical protein